MTALVYRRDASPLKTANRHFQGHKRWEKAVIPGLEAVRNLIHENMLPAMERVTLILSRLSGIARFHEEDDQIGFTNAEITRLVDILAALTLVYNRVLLIVMEELELFRTFSSWVRITIDRVSTSNPSDEIMEKEALLDPAKTLRYIERYLVRSPMATFLDTAGDFGDSRNELEDSLNVLDEVDKELRLDDEGKPFKRTIPQVHLLFNLLADRAGNVFKNIAEAEKRSVRFGQAVKLDLAGRSSNSATLGSVDMTMLSLHRPVSCSFPSIPISVSVAHKYDRMAWTALFILPCSPRTGLTLSGFSRPRLISLTASAALPQFLAHVRTSTLAIAHS